MDGGVMSTLHCPCGHVYTISGESITCPTCQRRLRRRHDVGLALTEWEEPSAKPTAHRLMVGDQINWDWKRKPNSGGGRGHTAVSIDEQGIGTMGGNRINWDGSTSSHGVDTVCNIRHANEDLIDVEATLRLVRASAYSEAAAAAGTPLAEQYPGIAAWFPKPDDAWAQQSSAMARGNQAACDRQMAQQSASANHGIRAQYTDFAAELTVAKKRIAELEASVSIQHDTYKALEVETEKWCTYATADRERADRLETLLGPIRDERDDLLRENAVLRRKLEAAERKAAKR